jgi:hypothetical protein
MDKSISVERISEAVVFNDVNEVTSIMEEIGLCTDGCAMTTCSGKRTVVAKILSLAAAGAYRHSLTDEMALRIIRYTACMVDFFDFARAVTYAADCKLRCDYAIPDNLRGAIKEIVYTPKLGKIIDEFSVSGFKDFLAYIVISDDVESVHTGYFEPILRYIYQHRVIPPELQFAMMGSHLNESSEERILRNAIILPPITLP